jgi:hypothetical protein
MRNLPLFDVVPYTHPVCRLYTLTLPEIVQWTWNTPRLDEGELAQVFPILRMLPQLSVNTIVLQSLAWYPHCSLGPVNGAAFQVLALFLPCCTWRCLTSPPPNPFGPNITSFGIIGLNPIALNKARIGLDCIFVSCFFYKMCYCKAISHHAQIHISIVAKPCLWSAHGWCCNMLAQITSLLAQITSLLIKFFLLSLQSCLWPRVSVNNIMSLLSFLSNKLQNLCNSRESLTSLFYCRFQSETADQHK